MHNHNVSTYNFVLHCQIIFIDKSNRSQHLIQKIFTKRLYILKLENPCFKRNKQIFVFWLIKAKTEHLLNFHMSCMLCAFLLLGSWKDKTLKINRFLTKIKRYLIRSLNSFDRLSFPKKEISLEKSRKWFVFPLIISIVLMQMYFYF